MPTLKTRGWGCVLIQLASLRERVWIQTSRTVRLLLAKRSQKKKGEDRGAHPRNTHPVPASCFRPRRLGPPRSRLNAQAGKVLRFCGPSTELTCVPCCTFRCSPLAHVVQKQNKTRNQFITTFPWKNKYCGLCSLSDPSSNPGFAAPSQCDLGKSPELCESRFAHLNREKPHHSLALRQL